MVGDMEGTEPGKGDADMDSDDSVEEPWEYKGQTMTPKMTKKGNRRQSEVDWLDEVSVCFEFLSGSIIFHPTLTLLS